MKIKLIMPPRNFLKEAPGMISIPPLGIAHLAAFLRKNGYDVEVDDLDIKIINDKKLFDRLLMLQKKYTKEDLENYLQNNQKNSFLYEITDLLLKKIEYKGYDVIGFSVIDTLAIDSTLLISKKIKEETGAKIILGGGCASPKHKERYRFIDYVILGYGENQFLDIINESQKKSLEVEKILPGTFPNLKPDFSGLPFLCYKNMPKECDFSNPGKILILPYLWTLKCPHKCSFCGNSLESSEPIFKPVHQTIKELKELSSKYNTKYFFMLNSYFNVDREYATKFCKELVKEKIDILWCESFRCDTDSKILSLLSKAGCFYATFGMESASNKILKKMKKEYDCKTAEKTIKEAHKAGMLVNLFIIVCFPHETEEDFHKTFDFVNKNIDCIDRVNVCPFYLTKSEILEEPEKFGIKIRKRIGPQRHTLSVYEYDESGGCSWEELQKIKQKRLEKLQKLVYIYKKIPGAEYKATTHKIYYLFDKFKNKEIVLEHIKDEYHKQISSKERTIYITDKCNNNCLFCKKPKETLESIEDVKKKIEDLKKEGIKKIIISGGEPTIVPSIFEIISVISKEGFQVELKTNARMLSYPSFCEKLIKFVGIINVTIHSHKPYKHDRVTQVKGSFEQTIKGIENWKKLGGQVKIDTVVSEYNKEDMYEFVDFIMENETISIF